MNIKLSFAIIFLQLLASCSSKKVSNISYSEKHSQENNSRQVLNVFSPKEGVNNKPVLIFVHGGNWQSGSKGLYGLLGRNFAKKDVVTVIPNYTLSPKGDYKVMANDISKAIDWTVKNIEKYGGDPNKIFLMGHSAGGHLVALVTTSSKYDKTKNQVKGVILNDAFGLDMNTYFKDNAPTKKHNYLATWSKNPEEWKKGSPIFHVESTTPNYMMYIGTKTYPEIKSQSKDFLKVIQEFQPSLETIYNKKKHVGMITQYFCANSDRFKEVLNFMNSN